MAAEAYFQDSVHQCTKEKKMQLFNEKEKKVKTELGLRWKTFCINGSQQLFFHHYAIKQTSQHHNAKFRTSLVTLVGLFSIKTKEEVIGNNLHILS